MPIRPIEVTDLPQVLEWRNAPLVRESMVNTSVIAPDEHRAWFQRIRNDHTCRWMIVSDDAGPLGVGYLTDIDTGFRTARWGFYKVPGLPPGTGTRVCLETLTYAFDQLELRKIVGNVRRTNPASIRMHEKLGFERDSRLSDPTIAAQGNHIIRFVLQRHRWNSALLACLEQHLRG